MMRIYGAPLVSAVFVYHGAESEPSSRVVPTSVTQRMRLEGILSVIRAFGAWKAAQCPKVLL
jgi:hypothetical protein